MLDLVPKAAVLRVEAFQKHLDHEDAAVCRGYIFFIESCR